jgi:8-oxo-dGTP pyrophosphatase MutT (NUDIX family)
MYKVFFNDRIALLTDDFIRNFQLKYGLFYKYRNVDDLKELIDFYWNLKRIDVLFIFHHDLDELQERFKSCFRLIEAAGGLIRDDRDRYLVMKRREKWDLPKGKVNKGETIPHAAIREVSEECGIHELEIQTPLLSTYHCYRFEGESILKRTSWFAMQYSGTEEPVPQRDEDITEIQWLAQEDLRTIIDNTYMGVLDVLKYANLL